MLQTQRLTREEQKDFKEVFTSVSQASNLFQDDQIWSSQCDHVLAGMQRMSKLAQHLYQILDEDTSRMNDTSCYQLIEMLRNIEKLLDRDLIPYIKEFRVICRTSSVQATRQRQRIQYKLELLLSDGKNVLNDMSMLLDRICFEERKLESVY